MKVHKHGAIDGKYTICGRMCYWPTVEMHCRIAWKEVTCRRCLSKKPKAGREGKVMVTWRERFEYLRHHRNPLKIEPYGFYIGVNGPFKTDIEAIDFVIRVSKTAKRRGNK